MADNVTTQTATLASVPGSTVIETHDTGAGHRQIVAVGGSGDKTSSTAAPTAASAAVVLAANADRKSATIHNAGAQTVELGDSTITYGDGLPLAPGQTLADDSSVDAWYGITSSGTGDLRIIEVA